MTQLLYVAPTPASPRPNPALLIVQGIVAALIATSMLSSAEAMPSVEGFDLISSTRIDATAVAYTYSLRIRGDDIPYTGATVAVSSRSPSVMVTKSNVQVGNVDAGTFVRTSDTFEIRLDGQTSLNPAKLKFVVFGLPTESVPGKVQFGAVEFLEPTGRAGHQVSGPIQTSGPRAGSVGLLRATICDATSTVSFDLLDTTGAGIGSGGMVNTAETPCWYFAAVDIPRVPFYVRIKAATLGGTADSWTSSQQYQPLRFALSADAGSRSASAGIVMIPITIRISDSTVEGDYTVEAILPSGVEAVSGVASWRVALRVGSEASPVFRLMVRPAQDPGSSFTLLVKAYPTGSASNPDYYYLPVHFDR